MTGPGANRHKPKKEWVQAITDSCREDAVSVFMKGNLEETWAAPLIQEYPTAMMAWGKEEPDNGKTAANLKELPVGYNKRGNK